jgi:AraC-like DNA-binding protein
MPTLATPPLLGTLCSETLKNLDGLQRLLELSYTIHDLEPIATGLSQAVPVHIEGAVAVCGEVGMVSVLGSAITVAVEPRSPTCFLALPTKGWASYKFEDQLIENIGGQTIAYLPPQAWRLSNDGTGGTAIQFQEQAILSRAAAMADHLDLVQAYAQLAVPFSIATDQQPISHFYLHLLGALAIVDSSWRHGLGVPHPMLGLDDLILRCVALILFPQFAAPANERGSAMDCQDIRRTTHALMEWMIANLDQPISLSEIEQRSNYGRRAIQMGFKTEVGCGPIQWLRRQRLQLAFQQLQTPGQGQTVTSVAQACGYLNLASFSRDFRERFGLSASKMLRQSRQAP